MEQGAEQFLPAGFLVGQDNAGVLYPQQHGGGQSGEAEQLHLMAYPRPAGGTAQTAQQSRVVHRPGFPAHRPHKAAVGKPPAYEQHQGSPQPERQYRRRSRLGQLPRIWEGQSARSVSPRIIRGSGRGVPVWASSGRAAGRRALPGISLRQRVSSGEGGFAVSGLFRPVGQYRGGAVFLREGTDLAHRCRRRKELVHQAGFGGKGHQQAQHCRQPDIVLPPAAGTGPQPGQQEQQKQDQHTARQGQREQRAQQGSHSFSFPWSHRVRSSS